MIDSEQQATEVVFKTASLNVETTVTEVGLKLAATTIIASVWFWKAQDLYPGILCGAVFYTTFSMVPIGNLYRKLSQKPSQGKMR